MLGNFFRRSTGRKKRVNKNRTSKVTILPQAFLCPRLRQHRQFQRQRFLVKTVFYAKKSVKTKEITIRAES